MAMTVGLLTPLRGKGDCRASSFPPCPTNSAGVRRTAAIGLKKVIPAMPQGQHTSVVAIASGDLAKAQEAAGTNVDKVFFKMQEASSRA
jgi:hypothetical protein